MPAKRTLIFAALLCGVFWCAVDRFQPFHMRSLEVRNFSHTLEWKLRDWGDGFMAFYPAGHLAARELDELQRKYPLTIRKEWNFIKRSLVLTAVPFNPTMKVLWRHHVYLVSSSGEIWDEHYWHESLAESIPDLPSLKVGDSYPLLRRGNMDGAGKLGVDYRILAEVRRILGEQEDFKVSDLTLLRRGGVDTVSCHIEDSSGKSFDFIGKVSTLKESVAVIREILRAKNNRTALVDATHSDKIIIKNRPRTAM